MPVESYNLRVYGILIRDDNQAVLVTDEIRMGFEMTKFPGGGHEFGESISECLIREWQEELSTDIELLELFYLNDFLQLSKFDPTEQIIGVYYLVRLLEPLQVPIKTKRYDFDEIKEEAQIFRWLTVDQLIPENFTFPIDKVVAEKLAKKLHE